MALTGFMVQGTCYATGAEAGAAYLAQFPVISGSILVSNESSAFNGDGIYGALRAFNLSNGQSFTFYPNVKLVPCDPAVSPAATTAAAMFSDGVQMGWGVVGAMFAALAVIFIKKSFFR